MKRIISIILALCLILSLSVVAFADFWDTPVNKEQKQGKQDNQGKQELTFRGISFGTTFKEAIAQLREQGIDSDYLTYEDDCMYIIIFVDKISVADYDMILSMNFRWASADNNNIDDSIFMRGMYSYNEEFTNADVLKVSFEQCTNDLIDKLNSLYGRYTQAPDTWIYNKTYPRTVIASWDERFLDDNLIILKAEATNDRNGMKTSILINYFDKMAEDTLKEIIIEAQNKTHDKDSTDGL